MNTCPCIIYFLKRIFFGSLIALVLQVSLSAAHGFAESFVIPSVEETALSGRGIGYSSPAVAELDGNSSNGREIVLGGSDGVLHARRADGTELWTVNLPGSDCPLSPQKDKLYSSPVVGALRGDGVPYVVVGYGGFKSAKCEGGVAAYRGSDGTLFWNFSVKDFAQKKGFFAYRTMVFSTPALADVNGDGTLEVGFGAFDRNVYLLNSDGTLRWYYHAADTVWSSPVFANVDGDSNLEMIIGTDITKNGALDPPTQDGGFLYAFDTQVVSGGFVPFRDPKKKITKWRRYFDQVVYSSPVIGEVLSSKRGKEIVIGSGCYFPAQSLPRKGNEYRVLSLKTGKVLKRISTPLCSASSAAIGDINNDGMTDIVLMIDTDIVNGGDGKGTVMAITPETGATLWSVSTRALFPFQSPVLSDLGGDGTLEVVVSEATSLAILSGATGAVMNRIRLPGTVQSTAAVTDLEGNGLVDIVSAGGKGGDGGLYVLRDLSAVE